MHMCPIFAGPVTFKGCVYIHMYINPQFNYIKCFVVKQILMLGDLLERNYQATLKVKQQSYQVR